MGQGPQMVDRWWCRGCIVSSGGVMFFKNIKILGKYPYEWYQWYEEEKILIWGGAAILLILFVAVVF